MTTTATAQTATSLTMPTNPQPSGAPPTSHPTPNQPSTGTFRFTDPDLSIPGSERALFAMAAAKSVSQHALQLHDARTSPSITKGPGGIDAQGFTYINHRSALQNSDQWFSGSNVEDIYLPEVCKLVCEVTGAKRAIVNNVAFRRRLADAQADPKFYFKRGHPLDGELAKLPKDVALVMGKEEGGSLEPARAVHIDYSVDGLRRTMRECRRDIAEMGKEALEAEDRVARGEEGVEVPRYAAFSVWRPVKTVRRDPLAVCDWRTVDRNELVPLPYRALSDMNENGEYMMEALAITPPKKPAEQKWYWIPEQQPDEVLIIKFADTQAEKDPSVAGGCPHISPEIPGTEDEEARVSIEARVLAFW